jgi:ATP-dependent RNA helicase DDX21
MHKSTIVFVPTKKECNILMVSEKLKQEVLIIHGDINQKQREASIEAFKSGKVNVLVATDVASRGLDIPMVDLVIQSEPPKEIDSYIHRAGRTARAGRTGTCITLYTKMTEGLLTRIEQKAKINFKKIGAPQRKDIINASIRDIKSKLSDIHESSIVGFQKEATNLLTEYEPTEIVSRLLAFLAGQTDEMKSRSILCGAEGFVTYQLDATKEFYANSYVWGCLRKVFPQSILERARGMKVYKSQKGAVIDLQESDVKEAELAIKSFKVVNPGFTIKKCDELPELAGVDHRPSIDVRKRKDVFIGNLPYHCTEDDLINHLASNGITKEGMDVRFVNDKETGTHKGFCFVSVYDDDKFSKILTMKNKVMGGKQLRIDDAANKSNGRR